MCGFNLSNVNPSGNHQNLERILLHEVCTDLGPVVEVISILFPNLKHLVVNQWHDDSLEESEYSHSLQHLGSLKANSAFYALWVIKNIQLVCQTSKYITALDISLQRIHHLAYSDSNYAGSPCLRKDDLELIFEYIWTASSAQGI